MNDLYSKATLKLGQRLGQFDWSMIKIGLFCSCLLLLSCDFFQPVSPAPEAFFVKFFGNSGDQEGHAIQVFDEHTTYVFGHTEEAIKELYLIEMDEAGNENWARIISGETSLSVDMKLTDNREHLLLLSESEIGNDFKLRLTKTDLLGEVVWDKTFNTQNANTYEAARISLISGSDNVLVIGTQTIQSGTEMISQIYVIEVDDNGDLVWEKSYNFLDRKAEFGVDVMAYNGNVVVLGRSIGLDDVERPILIEAKRTSIGEELQSEILFQNNSIGLPTVLTAQEMLLTDNDEFLLLCNDDINIGILKVTVSSEVRITPVIPVFLNFNMLPTRFTQTQNDDLLITGVSENKVGLIRVDEEGENVWNTVRTFGIDNIGNSINRGQQVVERSDGSILVVGTIDFSDKKMIGVIKTNGSGTLE